MATVNINSNMPYYTYFTQDDSVTVASCEDARLFKYDIGVGARISLGKSA